MPLRPSSKSYATKREPEGGGEPSRSASKQRTPREPDDNETERPPMAYLPYVAGISERIRKVCQDFNIRTVFKSGPSSLGGRSSCLLGYGGFIGEVSRASVFASRRFVSPIYTFSLRSKTPYRQPSNRTSSTRYHAPAVRCTSERRSAG